MLDHEDREWSRKFGESYLDCNHAEEHLDTDEMDRLEEEFHQAEKDDNVTRSDFGTLEYLSDTAPSQHRSPRHE